MRSLRCSILSESAAWVPSIPQPSYLQQRTSPSFRSIRTLERRHRSTYTTNRKYAIRYIQPLITRRRNRKLNDTSHTTASSPHQSTDADDIATRIFADPQCVHVNIVAALSADSCHTTSTSFPRNIVHNGSARESGARGGDMEALPKYQQ